MRDRLIHHYYDINLDVLWQMVSDDFPQLLSALPPTMTTDLALSVQDISPHNAAL